MTHIGIFSSRKIGGNPGEWGGVHTHLKNLVSVLLRGGHQVSLFTQCEKKREDGKLTVLPIWNWREGKESRRLIRRAQRIFHGRHKEKPMDCVFSEGIAARCLKDSVKSTGIPLVSFVHNLHMHYFHNNIHEVNGVRALKSFAFRSVPRYIHGMFAIDIPFLKNCQKIVTGNSAIASDLRRFYRIPEKRIVTIHNWVDVTLFRKCDEHMIVKPVDIPPSKTVFLTAGFLWRPKGFHLVLRAFQQLIRKAPDAFLLIIGDGPERGRLESFIQNRPELKANVRLMGQTPHENMHLLYSMADIFVIPSLLNEVLPYTLLEAMSCELPIIASDIPANREALGPSGHFVKKGDVNDLREAMLRFMSDLPNMKSQARIHGKRVAERFSHEAASEKIAALLGEVLG